MSVVNRLYGAITRDRWEIGFVEGGVDAVMSNNGRPKINWMQHDFKTAGLPILSFLMHQMMK